MHSRTQSIARHGNAIRAHLLASGALEPLPEVVTQKVKTLPAEPPKAWRHVHPHFNTFTGPRSTIFTCKDSGERLVYVLE